jgi:hypothetical protein
MRKLGLQKEMELAKVKKISGDQQKSWRMNGQPVPKLEPFTTRHAITLTRGSQWGTRSGDCTLQETFFISIY